MKRAVVWSNSARNEVLDIIRFIAGANPDAAERVVDTIDHLVANLGDMATGCPGRVTGTYEKVVPRVAVHRRLRGGRWRGTEPCRGAAHHPWCTRLAVRRLAGVGAIRVASATITAWGTALTTPQIATGGEAFTAQVAALS